jgi:hypothetical protein
MTFIIAILTVYGITNIVTQGSIFDPVKEKIEELIATNKHPKKLSWLLKLINCPMCFGFWVGALVGIFMGPFIGWNIIFNGGLYSGTTWILHCIMQLLGQGYDPSRTINVVFSNDLSIKDIKETHETQNQ